MALQASQAARKKFEDPDIKLEPDVPKDKHKMSAKPDVLARSRTCLRVLSKIGEVDKAGAEVALNALRACAITDNMTVMQAVDS